MDGNTMSWEQGKLKYVFLAAFILILGSVFRVYASFSLFGPEDLGVEYTHEDYVSAQEKTGIQAEYEGLTGEELEAYKQEEKRNGEKKSIQDYNFEFSGYERKEFTLTNEEATALLNELAPGFWWFDNLQVKVLPDGTMEGSSTADIMRLKSDLYSDVAEDVPIPLPDKLNIYSKGRVSIKNNQLDGDPEALILELSHFRTNTWKKKV